MHAKRYLSILIAALFLTTATPLLAAEFKGVTLDDTLTLESSNLTLQGMGIRKKFFISVYVGGLYLTTPTQDAAAAIAADEAKRITMVFKRDVGGEKMVGAFQEGFEENAAPLMEAIKDRADTFLALFKPGVKENQRIDLTYQPGKGTSVAFDGKEVGVIEGADFMAACWAIWFGPEPPSSDLKEGMLGID